MLAAGSGPPRRTWHLCGACLDAGHVIQAGRGGLHGCRADVLCGQGPNVRKVRKMPKAAGKGTAGKAMTGKAGKTGKTGKKGKKGKS